MTTPPRRSPAVPAPALPARPLRPVVPAPITAWKAAVAQAKPVVPSVPAMVRRTHAARPSAPPPPNSPRAPFARRPPAVPPARVRPAVQLSSFPGQSAFPVHLRPKPGGQTIPAPVREKLERALGHDFSDVRIHVGHDARRIGAAAFTWGSQIHFAPGQYQPHSPEGQRLLAHELTHVVQQRQGRVRNPFGTGVAVVQDRALESEAERAGQLLHRLAALAARGAAPASRRTVQPRRATAVQRDIGFEFEFGCPSREPRPGRPGRFQRIAKGAVILNSGGDIELQGEDAADGSAIEFVTNHFPESRAGRTRLRNAVRWMRAVMRQLAQQGAHGVYVPANQLTPAGFAVNVVRPAAEIESDHHPTTNPQVTTAFRLDRLHWFMQAFHQQPGSARAAFAAGRTPEFTNVAARVRAAEQYLAGQHHAPSRGFLGLLSLIATYCLGSRTAQTVPYVKSVTRFLLRTDFAAAFALCPESPHYAGGAPNLLALNHFLEACRLAGNEPTLNRMMLKSQGNIFKRAFFRMLGHMTLRQWLTGIYNNHDQLKRTTYPVASFRGELESLGGRGNTTEQVGGQAAPIIELRTLVRNVGMDLIEPLTMDLFDNLVRVNTGAAPPQALRMPAFERAVNRTQARDEALDLAGIFG